MVVVGRTKRRRRNNASLGFEKNKHVTSKSVTGHRSFVFEMHWPLKNLARGHDFLV